MPTDPEENSGTNRGLQLPSCFSHWLAKAISLFSTGLLLGASGGLLLGGTAVVVIQSVELLSDNRPLMEWLENLLWYPNRAITMLFKWMEDDVPNLLICAYFKEFVFFSLTLSLAVGLFIGFSTYRLVITKYGETAMGKALSLAGSVCLMGMTAIGYIVGQSLEGLLFIFSRYRDLIVIDFFMMMITILCSAILVLHTVRYCHPELLLACVLLPFCLCHLMVMAVGFVLSFSVLFQTKLCLLFNLFPIFLYEWNGDSLGFQIISIPVPLILIITDVFNIARHPIVTLQSTTNTSSAVAEGVFVGVLTSQLFMVVIGMSLFLSWQKGGAAKICAGAAASGGAIVTVMKSVLPVLGPGPAIGALMGVSGAVGVCLSAARTATDQYGESVDQYRYLGRLGVTVGAGVGAFLISSTHSGLSWIFMGLCGAVISAGPDLKLLLFVLVNRRDKLILCLRIVIIILLLTWLCFTITIIGGVYIILTSGGYIILFGICFLAKFVVDYVKYKLS